MKEKILEIIGQDLNPEIAEIRAYRIMIAFQQEYVDYVRAALKSGQEINL